jgi:predicted HNH restriction endonuclease
VSRKELGVVSFELREGEKPAQPALFCEICEFDFESEYGERGKDYIEAHHKKPISELDEEVILRIEDLAMVCSNCHGMLHRPPWITIEGLKEIIEEDRD